MAIPVSDSLSNFDEQIEAAARIIGRSGQAQAVFSQIYYGKKKVKSVREIAENIGLNPKQVLTQGKKLSDNHIVDQSKINGETCYQKIPFFNQNKSKILALARNSKRRLNYPTKRKLIQSSIVTIKIDKKYGKAVRVTIDDIDSFGRVKDIKPSGNISSKISENSFKNGIKNILIEEGDFKDWGGEKNDLYSTRMLINGKRIAVSLALKGPGTKGVLVPAKMGKNGDQIQRLFQTDADLFIVQYWNRIDQSIVEQLEAFAVAKSMMTQKTLYYCIIDGIDSNRIYLSYKENFH
jgi:hypothetical protein